VSKFNGMTQIELEMMNDVIEKALPVWVMAAPSFAKLTSELHKEFKKLGHEGIEAISLAVHSAAKQFGL